MGLPDDDDLRCEERVAVYYHRSLVGRRRHSGRQRSVRTFTIQETKYEEDKVSRKTDDLVERVESEVRRKTFAHFMGANEA